MSDPNDKAKEEVVVLAGGVRARMMAYQQEIQRKEKAAKKNKPVFKVADDLGVSFHDGDGAPLQDKLPVQDDVEMSISQVETDLDESHVFQRSMNMSGKVSFVVVEPEITEEELNEPEKPQEVKDEEEKEAKEKISRLLGRDEEAEEKGDEAPVVMQAFSAVQRRYLRAIGKLRPEPLQIKKEVVQEEEKAPDPEHKEFIRKKLSREMTKSAHLTALTSTWDDYYEKAQDKPTEEAEVKQVEEEIKQAEEKVNSEWSEFAEQVIEQVVEIVGEENDDDSVKSEDSDMVKWREEARRLKAEAEERKKQKAEREERKKKRAQIAALRKKRAEEAAARKQAEEEAQREEDAARLEAAAELEAARRLEEAAKKRAAEEEAKKAAEAAARKKAEESDSSDSGSSDDSSSEPEPEKPKETKPAEQPTPAAATQQAATISPPPSPKKGKAAKAEKVEKVESDSESSEDNRQTKKKSKKKKEKEREVKEKDILDVKEKKEKKKDKKKKKKKGEDDLDDGWVEEYPRNFDGTLWKNPLKFWTNKPTKLNEVAPKVIMRVSSCFVAFCAQFSCDF